MIFYIVKKAFKSYGVFHPVGELINDKSTIRNFKTKMYSGRIIQISSNQHDFFDVINLLEKKYHISLLEQIKQNMRPVMKEISAKTPEKSMVSPPLVRSSTAKVMVTKPKVISTK